MLRTPSPFKNTKKVDIKKLSPIKQSEIDFILQSGSGKPNENQQEALMDILETVTEFLAIFYGEKDVIQCENIENCIELLKWRRELSELSIEDLCADESNLIWCYYKRLKSFSDEQLEVLGRLYLKCYQKPDIREQLNERFKMTRNKLSLYLFVYFFVFSS